MIKVLIADDEPLLLRSLKKSIEMMDGEYSVIDTASDGKSALKKAEALNPDVIFTDIRMPIFDGLEFVGKLREKGISAKIVLISGYKEFEYAKKAITLGVEDYLVKPINPLVLQKILQKMKAELQEDIHEKQEAYLQAVIHGGKIEMEDCFFDEKTEICVLYLCFGTYISYRNIQFKINDDSSYNKEIIQILDAQNKKYWILDGKYDNERIVVIKADKITGDHLGREIYQAVQDKLVVNVTGVYNSGIRTAEQFREKMLETGIVLRKKLIFSEGRYIEAQKYSEERLKKKASEGRISDYGYFERMIKDKKYQDIGFFIKKRLRECQEEHWTQEELTELLRGWLFTVEQQLRKHFESSMIDLTVTVSQDYDELEKNLVNFFESVIDEQDENPLSQVSVHTMESVKEYIDYHYTEKLSIMEIADKFNFSYSYLCTSFKRYFGESPNDYIIKKRIYKAKLLFDSDPVLSIKETAAMTGYDNPYYFSRIFKNVTGISPSQYKKRSNEKNEI